MKHETLSDEEFMKRLQLLAEVADEVTVADFRAVIKRHRDGQVIGEWIGKRWVLIGGIMGGFVATVAFRGALEDLWHMFFPPR